MQTRSPVISVVAATLRALAMMLVLLALACGALLGDAPSTTRIVVLSLAGLLLASPLLVFLLTVQPEQAAAALVSLGARKRDHPMHAESPGKR